MLPGCDGELEPSTNIWLKGIVFTTWSDMLRPAVKPGYRVSVGFKRGISAVGPPADFHALYERVASVAVQRMSELVARDPNLAVSILCHGWRLLGEAGKVATAFITLAIRSPEEGDNHLDTGRAPSVEELRTPGGTSLDDLARLAQQHPDELYSEFDFTDASAPGSDLITVSYGESFPRIPNDSFDFEPCVARAEAFANSYHKMLERFGEVRSPFRATRREWFLVDRKLATIPICFSRYKEMCRG